ncbi:hypothetical protein HDU67_001433 [Dinochytrium kinnereticum]|nr:hypothetical protein HDU67_001433 [Dinochytrium kinnereticum]
MLDEPQDSSAIIALQSLSPSSFPLQDKTLESSNGGRVLNDRGPSRTARSLSAPYIAPPPSALSHPHPSPRSILPPYRHTPHRATNVFTGRTAKPQHNQNYIRFNEQKKEEDELKEEMFYETLNAEATLLASQLRLTPEEIEARNMAIGVLEGLVKGLWGEKGVSVQVFGSFATGLSLPDGDLDVVLCVGCEYILQRVHDALIQTSVGRKLADKASIRLVLNARIPVLRFTTVNWGIKIDITANAVTGGISSSLVKLWVKRYHPVLEPATLILKRWLVDRSFDEVYTGGLGGYSLSKFNEFILIHKFKFNPFLRPLTPQKVNMIVAILQQNPDIQSSDHALGRALYEFFLVYGSTFDYDRLMVSVRGGRGICLRGGGPFAQTFRPRFGGYYYDAGQSLSIAIEDPADANRANNVSKGTFRMHDIKVAMLDSHMRLELGLSGDIPPPYLRGIVDLSLVGRSLEEARAIRSPYTLTSIKNDDWHDVPRSESSVTISGGDAIAELSNLDSTKTMETLCPAVPTATTGGEVDKVTLNDEDYGDGDSFGDDARVFLLREPKVEGRRRRTDSDASTAVEIIRRRYKDEDDSDEERRERRKDRPGKDRDGQRGEEETIRKNEDDDDEYDSARRSRSKDHGERRHEHERRERRKRRHDEKREHKKKRRRKSRSPSASALDGIRSSSVTRRRSDEGVSTSRKRRKERRRHSGASSSGKK